MPQPGELVANEGRETVSLEVTNAGDRPIQVGSHYHFVETNRALVFDRAIAYGKRLDIPRAPPCDSSRAKRGPSRWSRSRDDA